MFGMCYDTSQCMEYMQYIKLFHEYKAEVFLLQKEMSLLHAFVILPKHFMASRMTFTKSATSNGKN